jgi:hypothetical protein
MLRKRVDYCLSFKTLGPILIALKTSFLNTATILSFQLTDNPLVNESPVNIISTAF